MRFKQTLNFLDIFSKYPQISIFMKMCPIGAELFYAVVWMDMTKLIVAFRNSAKAPKNKTIQQSTSLRFYYFLTQTTAAKSVSFRT
jgi:hypothetical protein